MRASVRAEIAVDVLGEDEVPISFARWDENLELMGRASSPRRNSGGGTHRSAQSSGKSLVEDRREDPTEQAREAQAVSEATIRSMSRIASRHYCDYIVFIDKVLS